MAIFESSIFDGAIFDCAAGWTSGQLDIFHARFMEEVGNYAEWYEHNIAPRPTFTCTKALLRAEWTILNALMPTTRATLKAALTLVPAAYQDMFVDHLLTENVSGYCQDR